MTGLMLCTDLDRTLLPNGSQPESPRARELFGQLAARPEITLVYATGRDLDLACEALTSYDLPRPDHLIADVGTAIYSLRGGQWERWTAWDGKVQGAWGHTGAELHSLLADLSGLRLQEDSRQTTAKLSYYVAASADREAVLAAVRERFAAQGVLANLIWSEDESADCCLLDVLPASATKLQAVEFLLARTGQDLSRVLYAGDSGNDWDVLVSSLPAVLVANASEELKNQALQAAGALGRKDKLYVARGGFLGLNGNYAGGVLEGVAHFFPATAVWLEEEV